MSRILASLSGVSKRYGEQRALERLSLEVRAGEVVGLLGANGAGKTTALRILCGLLPPDEGAVALQGIDLLQDPVAAKKNLGYVPDGAPLYSNLSAEEHLDLVAGLHGLEPVRARAEATRLLEGFELLGRRGDPVGAFSRGMRQKLAIACALLPRPPLLVLDEPLTGLDIPSASLIKALIRAWAERGGGVLLTSHLLEIVERACDRMVVLARGRVLVQGTLEDLRRASGRGGDLEEVFRALTAAEDPTQAAARILGS
ncbi:MAG TPA: ABC transporter ATP-binding protein [Planctomycetota bacterium]